MEALCHQGLCFPRYWARGGLTACIGPSSLLPWALCSHRLQRHCFSGACSGDLPAALSPRQTHLLVPLACTNVLPRSITLSIFPGVLAEDVHSAQLGSWYSVALLTAFNFADWAGKSLPGVPALRLRCGAWMGRGPLAKGPLGR